MISRWHLERIGTAAILVRRRRAEARQTALSRDGVLHPSAPAAAVDATYGRGHRTLALAVALASSVVSTTAWGQRVPAATDDEIVAQASLVAAGDRVEIYQHGVKVSSALLKIAETAYAKLEALTGRTLDTATLGPKIRIYVSNAIVVSHVWRGYQHPKDPQGVILLSGRAYPGALNGTNATYAHEMAHLFTWRYYSHTLREGLADYLALQIHPGAGVGPNPDGYAASARIPRDIAECLGTTKPPPAFVTSEMTFRRMYYFASFRFVKYLIETAGMATFLRLYDSDDPETEMTNLYGAPRAELLRRAGI